MQPYAYMWIIRGERAAAAEMERIMGGPDAVRRLYTPDRAVRAAATGAPAPRRRVGERRPAVIRRLLPFLAR